MNAFSVIGMIAEQRIVEAQKAGAFQGLDGEGEPLELEDLSHIPPELRMAYKILKNAGCLPAEIQERREISSLLELLDNCGEEKERLKALKKLKLLISRLPQGKTRNLMLESNDEYYMKILAKLEKHERMAEQGKTARQASGK